MTQSETRAARANRSGDPCPPWCTSDHAGLNAHISYPMTRRLPWQPRVALIRSPGDRRPYIDVMKIAADFQFDCRDAARFAELFEALASCEPDQLRELAADVRLAAATAQESE